MGTPLEKPRPTLAPSIKLREVGQYVDIALVHQYTRPVTVYGSPTGEQAKNILGKPKTQDVVVGVVIGGTARIVVDNVERPVQAGDVVSLWIAGHNRFDPEFDAGRAKGEAKSWAGAKKDRPPQIGDRMRWLYEAEIPGKGNTPKRVRTCRIGTNNDPALIARCEAAHNEMSAAEGHPLEDDRDPDPDPF